MKTTLKYNTIETFQRQPAWKIFIDTIVDNCKGLYDDHLIAEFEDGENITKDGIPISNIKLSESNEGIEPQINLKDLQPKYPVLDYLNDVIPLTLRENISLRGLLKTLSLYNCKIEDISFPKLLPHTYKTNRKEQEADTAVWGYEIGSSESYNYEAMATVDGTNNNEIGYDFIGEQPSPSYVTTCDYIYNIYGYSQKHPVINAAQIREVRDFYQFVVKTPNEYMSEYHINEQYFLADEYSRLFKSVYIDNNSMTIENGNYIISNDIFYYSINSHNSGIYVGTVNRNLDNYHVCRSGNYISNIKRFDEGETIPVEYEPNPLSRAELLKRCYNKTDGVKRWVVETSFYEYKYLNEPTRYVIIDKTANDLIKENSRIEFNSNSAEASYDTYIQSDASMINITLTKLDIEIGENPLEEQISTISMKYKAYTDSYYGNTWVVMDTFDNYFKISPYYLKEQLFADECSLKALPLFLYKHNDKDKVSMCANFIDAQGGENKDSYEIEMYDKDVIKTTYDTINNITNYSDCDVTGITYGDYFYRWEQINKTNETFIQNVYAAVNFSNYDMDGDTPQHRLPFAFFFNGGRDIYEAFHYDATEEDKKNNVEKVNGNYIYRNTFYKDYFETMCFNHFIKVYPIDGETDGELIKTNKLYCDNLDLVEFGDIIPYVVSYDRKGEIDEDGTSIKNLDCSVFSKILSYNKRTHLLIVDGGENGENMVWFKDSSTPKYVVVAYQNATPFNKNQMLSIIAPNYDVKEMMKNLLEEYKNQFCGLQIKSESNNLVLYSQRSLSTNNSYLWFYTSRPIEADEVISISLDVEATDVVWSTSGNYHRAGMEIAVQNEHNGFVSGYVGAWWSGTGSFKGRIKTENVRLLENLTNGFGIHIQNLGTGSITISNPQVEIGATATDYSPATVDLEYEPI